MLTEANPAAKRLEEKSARVLVAAREIIRETGDFDLPMRTLASRAQVSLRTPYEIFGSKRGVIAAILRDDQAQFRRTVRELQSADALEILFDRVRLGVTWFGTKQPFYRALFRATQGFSDVEGEPARENLRPFRILTERAMAAGLLRPELDAAIFGEVLTDIFASNMRTWASSDWDIELVYPKIGFGFATALAGVATESSASRMRDRALDYQAEIQAFWASTERAARAAQ
jgi:AcrR family transcriptional regulator